MEGEVQYVPVRLEENGMMKAKWKGEGEEG